MKRISLLLVILTVLYACNLVKYKQGKNLYLSQCAHCHMEDGSGVESLYPSLVDSKLTGEQIPCIIINGLNNEDSLLEMVGIKDLSDVEVSNITNYVIYDLQKTNQEIPINRINDILANCRELE